MVGNITDGMTAPSSSSSSSWLIPPSSFLAALTMLAILASCTTWPYTGAG